MNEQKEAFAQLFAVCWKDEALKDLVMSDPKTVLKEHGLDVPDGIDMKVVENAEDRVHTPCRTRPRGVVASPTMSCVARRAGHPQVPRKKS